MPIGAMLLRSVHDPEVARSCRAPPGAAALGRARFPDARLVEIFAAEMAADREAGTLAAPRRGSTTTSPASARCSCGRPGSSDRHASIEALAAIDPKWGERETWAAIRRAAGPGHRFLSARGPRPAARRRRHDRPRRRPSRRFSRRARPHAVDRLRRDRRSACSLGYPVAYFCALPAARTPACC